MTKWLHSFVLAAITVASFFIVTNHARAKQDASTDAATIRQVVQPIQDTWTLDKKALDITVYDQDGHKLKFYSDLIKDKTVAINFIFTSCTTICPPLAATFARVQKEMGDKVGRDVFFISISVDPATDTPERLKAWGAKFKAGAGWTFVTGAKADMDQLMAALGGSIARPEDHSPMLLIGNERARYWTRAYGLSPPSRLVQTIEAASAKSVSKD